MMDKQVMITKEMIIKKVVAFVLVLMLLFVPLAFNASAAEAALLEDEVLVSILEYFASEEAEEQEPLFGAFAQASETASEMARLGLPTIIITLLHA